MEEKRFDVEICFKVSGSGKESYEVVSKYLQTTREKVVALEALSGKAQMAFLSLYGDKPEVVKKVLDSIANI